jgi:signal transduction histidine kinase/ActR/RegA family two-component response regulator
MISLPNIVLGILLISGGLCGWLAIIAWQRSSTSTRAFAVSMLACSLWAVLYTAELLYGNQGWGYWVAHFEYIGIAILPAAWLIFSCEYQNSLFWQKHRDNLLTLITLVPITTVVLALTDPIHHLLWRSYQIEAIDNLFFLKPTYGAWFWLQTIVAYIFLFSSSYLLISEILKTRNIYRNQFLLLLVGVLLPWAANILYLARLSPIPNLDLSPVMFAISGLIFSWGIFQFRLLDILPIAQQLVLENIQELVFIINNNDEIIEANLNALKFIDQTFSAVQGLTLAQFLPDLWAIFQANPNPNQALASKITLKQPNQPFIYDFELYSRPILLNRKPDDIIGWMIMLRDITQQTVTVSVFQELNKALEDRVSERTTQLAEMNKLLASEKEVLSQRVLAGTEALQRINEQLAALAHDKDQFLATISHELRTPLSIILGISEGLSNNLYGDLSDLQRRTVQNLQNSGELLLTYINELLDLSHLETTKLELQITPVLIRQICQASLALVRPQAQKKDIQLLFECDPRINQLPLDALRFQQILVNLLSNAVKFTPNHGKVGLLVRALPEQGEVHFQVADTGVGIDTHELGHLFQPYSQLSQSLSTSQAGIGLGLVLVRQLTSLHNGRIQVQSKKGRGTMFTVSIPYQPEDEQQGAGASTTNQTTARDTPPNTQTQHATTADSTGHSPLILLCEDNPTNAELMSDYLKFSGYQVIHAFNGLEGLNLAQSHSPNLILMDVQMPVMDGLTAMRLIRKTPNFQTIPIIALTGLTQPQDAERCLQAGATAYLTKPIRLANLKHIIQTELQKSA